MKEKRKCLAMILVFVMLVTSVAYAPVISDAATSGSKTKNTKRYTISKRSGTYSSAVKVVLKAKKGYKIYYTTSGELKKNKLVKSEKKKTFNIKKTTTLSIYAVKKSQKVTAKNLKKIYKNKKSKYFKQYKYIIQEGKVTSTSAPQQSTSVTSSDETGANASQTPGVNASQTPKVTPGADIPDSTPGNVPDRTPDNIPDSTPENTFVPGTPSGSTQNPEGKVQVQDKINEVSGMLDADISNEEMPEPSTVEDDTPSITLSQDGMSSDHIESGTVTYNSDTAYSTLTIKAAGTYVLSGGTSDDPIKNLTIAVAKNISDDVNLIWDNLCIDNSELDSDDPVFSVGKSTTSVNITLKGDSILKGNGSYTDAPATAIINASDASAVLRFSAYAGEEDTATLTVVDSMPVGTDFGTNNPSDGIFSKGKLVMNSGIYHISVNGDCLKGTGKDGEGGIVINDGTYTLRSNYSNALKSKNGNIITCGGTIKSVYTKDDAVNAKNYSVIIKGGNLDIDNCYGDGIQGENVNISGDKTVISIKTYFENAGINYYNTSLGSGNYNTMTTSNTTKRETVNVDTGSHKGIKGGTKACTYRYTSVGETSKNTAGTNYTQEASGGIIISGGTISVDTTNTGIKYNGSMRGNSRPGQNSGSSGNLSAANSDGQYIIGSPDDAIHSNNICVIAGGTLDLASSDDGITAIDIMFINGCDITISQCYEGVEAGEIVMGASESSKEEPSVKIYSNDDGINASSKSVTYVYADESEEQYTKTSVSLGNNTFSVLAGYLNVMIADDQTHSFSLVTEDGNQVSGTYSANGDGIDCNGSFYAYGGTVIVYGSTSNDNSPVDTDNTYCIGSGVTLLAVGSNGMIESPTETYQAVVSYPSSGGSNQPGPGGSFGGPFGGMSGNSSFGANSPFAILDGSQNVLLSIKPIKQYSYILYSSPELTSVSSYTLYNGGEVSGTQLNTDNKSYDYRYTG